ncbi:some similarities with Saccharomyces cerevisiae YDR043C NRG1 Transcriptional repressor that recruits the Cyc8p-Tup1p complex to promoters [Maudiozyma barnettii]|uniref:Some similarities with Saccharomyces cerevisiae YDR043C NRG1 Transcriptional repressor that recruits the Cyc8p-Tup1p complex to promoters n=1 Tax=Maudiozyma barnettii TaxID=61262 RepID=A0A8H2ZFD7_9SACH|nr:transcriptional regulator NRG1 [Kazachstania barnettii]CAB4253121.1 some similarities with Saccharomyces cerevisiae YDR043C NRG1 Transcriptional repressor that recruits the Cyc8p-Tup1p complex to promoters [Kazachstania barnettii]CAD1780343.1 some similarities with Saccharomyces cerevisiae YDR043C NRG1 Transcriptional repressor that recruits the Cyc8p-Tup1p complex to promoters [Kazachstania barnettii]
MTTNFLHTNSQMNTMSHNNKLPSSYNDKLKNEQTYSMEESSDSNLPLTTMNIENSMVSTIKNASHVINVDASNNLNQLKGQTLLPSPDLSKIFDTDSLKLLDRNAFKYRENLNNLIYTRNNNGLGSYMEENPRKSQSISLGSLGNPIVKNISMFPPGNQSIASSNTSSRSSTPFNFTTSVTPISQASSISLNERFAKNIHFGTSMQDMSIPRTPMELSTAKGVNDNTGSNTNTATSSPVSSISSKNSKKSYTKKSHKKSKNTTTQAIGSKKDSLEQRRKYRCSVCPKGFTTSGHLARHNRIHTGEKNHACPYNDCKQRFSRQDNCLQHYRTHFKNNNGAPRTHEIITYAEASQDNRTSGMNYYDQQYK